MGTLKSHINNSFLDPYGSHIERDDSKEGCR